MNKMFMRRIVRPKPYCVYAILAKIWLLFLSSLHEFALHALEKNTIIFQ